MEWVIPVYVWFHIMYKQVKAPVIGDLLWQYTFLYGHLTFIMLSVANITFFMHTLTSHYRSMKGVKPGHQTTLKAKTY